MTKEEFRTCLNEHFYEHTPEEQEKMFNWMYDNMCVWTAYTDMASRVTFSREWLKGYKIKDMNVDDWKAWRRQINQLEKQLKNDKALAAIGKDFE